MSLQPDSTAPTGRKTAAASDPLTAPGAARSIPPRSTPFAPGTADALVAARDALRHTPVSRETLRAAIVRYGALSADAGAHASELTAPIEAALAPVLAQFPTAVAAELRVHVAWWAAHGYHRAD